MNAKIKSSLFPVLLLCFLMSTAVDVFAEPPRYGGGGGSFGGGGGGGRGGGARPSKPVTGMVVTATADLLIVSSDEGGEESFDITGRTIVVKEEAGKVEEIRRGDSILVFGSEVDSAIEASLIKVMYSAEGPPPKPSGPGGRPGGNGGGDRPRVVIGEVTSNSPLVINYNDDDKEIVISADTRIVIEVPTEVEELGTDVRVRIVSPPSQGGRGRMATRIIALSETDESFENLSREFSGEEGRGGHGSDNYSSSSSKIVSGLTLPDIAQQEREPEFIYGLWLGRGLFSNEELERGFRVARNLGVKYLKVEFKWDFVEKRNDMWEWTNGKTLDVEQVIKLAKKYDLSIIPYFDTFMPWGKVNRPSQRSGECEGPPSSRGQYPAPSPDEYAEYVTRVVSKLRDSGVDVGYIELDNEISNISDGYQSWNCFVKVSAKEIKRFENAAYDSVKARYPEIQVSTTTFSFPGIGSRGPRNGRAGDLLGRDNERRNSFIKAYFGDSPKPKFDFLGIHEVLSGTGNPYTIKEKPAGANYEYNFSSYNDVYDIWRTILDRYGYKDRPIFNLESAAVMNGKQDAELIQRVVFARANAKRNNVRGWVISQLSGSRRFTAGGEANVSVGITRLGDGYEMKEGYFGFYSFMSTLSKYPGYGGKVMGTLNERDPWVEKFTDGNGNMLYVAFIPYGLRSVAEKKIFLPAPPRSELKITTSGGETSYKVAGADGEFGLTVGERPLFIEVKKK